MLPLLFCIIFISCATRINGTLQADGQADLNVDTSLMQEITRTIRAFAAVPGEVPPDTPILNGPGIGASMTSAPGVASAAFRNRSPTAIEGTIRISQIRSFLASSDTAGFIGFEQSASGGRCTINLSLASGPRILSLLSAEIHDYLEALMAPLATGEQLTRPEYLELVRSVYGRVADEIAASTINVSLEFPGQIRSVRGGTYSGRRADFSIPLLNLLVLDVPLSYEVIWN